MKRVLKRKGASPQSLWMEVWNNIESYVSRQEAATAVMEAAAEAEQVVEGLRVAYATSGGKDSIALTPVMEAAGVRRAVWGMMPPFEFPEFMRWCEDNLPDYVDAEPQNLYDLSWLAQNRDKLFPADASSGYWWSMAGTRWSQTTYYKKNNLDMIVMGRRRIDGNFIGKERGVHTNRQGFTQYCPIRDWSHELTLAVCHYFTTGIPEMVYDSDDGFSDGTGSWPSRQHTGSWDNGWRRTWKIDPSRVEEAADYIPEAGDFIFRLQRGDISLEREVLHG